MKTKLEIIDETVEYYKSNKRATTPIEFSSDPNKVYCVYLTNDGRRCAFSRCCSIEGLDKMKNLHGGIDSLIKYQELTEKEVDSVLRDEYRGHSWGFWSDVQNIHDSPENWNNDVFTEEGEEMVKELKERYA